MTKKTYKSDAFAAIHETVSGLHAAGLVDKQTMREFNEACLTPIQQFTPAEIRKLRMREKASQAVFALYLNISKDAISQWERGEKKPAGPSLKLLNIVQNKGLSAIA